MARRKSVREKMAVKKGEMPENILVAGKYFAIDLSRDGLDSHEVGTTNVVGQILRIRPDQGFHAERDTVLHEVIHAAEYATHLDLKEFQVHALANTLLQVLRENPELTSYLVKPFPLD